MNRIFKIVLAANLVVLAGLVFTYPHLLVAPGMLIADHEKLEADCFACHAPFRGAMAERCATCHKPDEIGRLTTTGVPIDKPATSTPFHQKLIQQNCVACHSDHKGVMRYREKGYFNHALLQADTRDQCQTCHSSPTDTLHRQITVNCSQCHTQEKWKPASFDHALLPVNTRNQCQACHRTPTDALHRQITGNCGQCHTQEKWTPATFDHDKYFQLDRDHNVECVTCHVNNDFSRYTCYGCHEHTPRNIRDEHIEEGIRNFEDCVKCHRSADEDDIRMPGGERRSRERDDD